MSSQNRTDAADQRDDEADGLRQVERAAASGTLKPHEIFTSTGVVPYAWRVETDELIWGANAGEVLEVPDAGLIASGSAYARLVEQQDGRTRFDAVMNSGTKDDGAGVPYQVQYALRPTPDSAPLHWIEDSGRWFAGPGGTPARAHGIVQVIDTRRDQEQQLAYLSRFDALTHEMNRWRMTAVLEATIAETNPKATIVKANSKVTVDDPDAIRGKRVLVIEDGPTLTHGEMGYGAGVIAAQRFGAASLVDPRPYAVGSIAATFKKYPGIGTLLPAVGYGEKQMNELKQTIDKVDCDLVLIATPIDLRRTIHFVKPALRVTYELQEIGKPDLDDALDRLP